MNRTFHSKVDGWYWSLMAVTAFLLFDFFWLHYALLAVLLAICMIFEIEMLVHTRYVVTEDGMLRIESGRFVPGRTLDLNSIEMMNRVKSFSIAPALSVKRVEIVYRVAGRDDKLQVSPVDADEFISWIQKKTRKNNE